MNEGKKLEYSEIRQQIRQQTDVSTKIFASSIALTITIFGYVIESKSPDFSLYFLPLLVILSGFFIILSRFQTIYRLASYQKIFLEDDSIQYENRLSRFKKIGKSSKMKYGQMMVIFYTLLLISEGFIFFSKGFVGKIQIIAFTIIPILFFSMSIYLISKDWMKIYEEVWRKTNE